MHELYDNNEILVLLHLHPLQIQAINIRINEQIVTGKYRTGIVIYIHTLLSLSGYV